jgi:predicted ferric reductase
MKPDRAGRRDTPRHAPDAQGPRLPRRGVSPWLIALIYLVLILAPLGLALPNYLITARAPIDVVASALGMVAFAALLVDFVFSGRTNWISGRIGVRRTMQIHRWVAYATIVCIAIHPFLYTAPNGVSWPWFNADDPTLILGPLSLFSGLAAWILTAAIVLIAVDRKKLPGSYRIWRFTHAGSALVLGALIAVHAISAGGYSTQSALAIYWILLLCAGIVTLFEMFLVQPWRQHRRSRAASEHGGKGGDRDAARDAREIRRGPRR